ncbi:unnamed protein product [Triticum turgidum subsp. durum]|uniref:O-acyltransferase WSD1 C-terminal domain-containing protein n=1 Tax=Triticum turgidum subsp. durum TaxID=4567 RepID=A0A9R0VLS7_TRITD|nr:unnamed protein product [Triticum turgidum subsp. durum]
MLRDPPTLFKGAEGVEFRPKRFVNRTLSLDDVKYVKNTMNCVRGSSNPGYTFDYGERCAAWGDLCGIVSVLFSENRLKIISGESGRKSIKVRSTLLVNLRKTPGLHALATMMQSGKDNGAEWGNRLGYMILPFHIAMHDDDPLEYVRKATKVARRKKSSMESIFTYWSASMIMKIFGIKAAASLCYGMMRNTTLSFSNMAGPTEQVVFYGHPIVYIAPSVYGHPHALTMHYQSYMNIIKLVLAVEEEQFPDAHELLDDFAVSLKLIREAASAKNTRHT